jgi:hypothetical protein
MALDVTVSEGSVVFGGTETAVVRIRQPRTGASLTVTPNTTQEYDVTDFDTQNLYDADGSLKSPTDEKLSISTENGQFTEIDVTVSGDEDIFNRSIFAPYIVELQTAQGTVIDETEPGLRAVGYPGQFSQSATEGTIEVTFPRVASVNDSWDVEYTIQNDNRETLISKPVTNAQTQDNFSVNISSGRLSEGAYRQDLTLKQNESDPRSKQILRVFDLDGIRITDAKTVDDGDTDTSQDVTETASVTDGQATVTFPPEQNVTETQLTNLSADVSRVSVTPSSTNPSSDTIGLPTAGGSVGTFLEIAPENNAENDVSITQQITVTVTVEDSVVSGIDDPTLYHDVNSNGTYEQLDTEVSAGTEIGVDCDDDWTESVRSR